MYKKGKLDIMNCLFNITEKNGNLQSFEDKDFITFN